MDGVVCEPADPNFKTVLEGCFCEAIGGSGCWPVGVHHTPITRLATNPRVLLQIKMGLLHDQVTVSVTRPDWPVWS